MSRFPLLALALCAVVATLPTTPIFPSQYYVRIFVSLPYASIVEQEDYWYDAVAGNYRVDYYGGIDSYISQSATNMTYHIFPMSANSTGCFSIPGPVQMQSAFPDLSQFTYVNAQACPGDTPNTCNVWQYVSTVGSKTSTYTFYALNDGTPIHYTMMGYDSLFGSHYDQYEISYGPVQAGPIPAAQFAAPTALTCKPFPGTPGMRHEEAWAAENPAHDFDTQPHIQKDDPVELVFKGFARKHGKSYTSQQEREKRKQIFHNNMRFIRSHNRKGLSFKTAINHMADTTREERRAYLGTRVPVAANNGAKGVHTPQAVSALPSAIDWRELGAVTPVKDQGICGSCWSFGSHESIEGANFLKTGKLVRLASQSFVDCSWITGNTGCDGGNDYLAYQWALEYNQGRIPTEESYPYLMADGICHADRAVTGATITGWMNLTSGDINGLMDAVVTQGPISISIDASHDSLTFYSSGVYSDPQCGNTLNDLDHTVLLVGYTSINGVPVWIVKNSWSSHWGDEGYVYIQVAGNMCGVATSPTYVTM